MKNLQFFFSAFLMLVLATSCSKKADNTDTPSTDNTWKFADHTYKHNAPMQQGMDFYASNNKPFTLVKASTVTPSGNGLISGLNIVFNTHEPGIYTLKSQSTMISNLDAKYMYIEATIGNLQNQGAIYGSVDGNITVRVEKIDGKFVITATNAVSLNKLLDTGLNSSASSTFTCNKVK